MQRTFWPALAGLVLAAAACTDQPTTPAATSVAPLLGANAPDRVPGKYVVVFKDGVRDVRGTAERLTATPGARLERVFTHALRGFSAALPEPAVEALRRNPNVAFVEAEYLLELAQDPAVQSSPGWALDRIDQRYRVLDGAYRYYETGVGVTMYIVDSGVRTDHAEFGGRASTIFDGNGSTGDDCVGHGTGVASLAAGATLGVARQATILSLKVTSGCTKSVPSSYLIAAVDEITSRTARPAVVNVSVRKYPSVVQSEVGDANAVDAAIQNSINAGITYVVAAGNDTAPACDVTPARVASAITVSAVDTSDTRPSWANYGSCVDIMAPGVGVTMAGHASTTAVTSDDGTSFSSPLVAGIAALYLQVNTTATPAQVHSAVVAGGSRWQSMSNLNGSPQLVAFSRLVRTRPMTFETYLRERYRLSPNSNVYLWRSHYMSAGDWYSSGDYYIADATATQSGFAATTLDITDRNGGTLTHGDTVHIENHTSRKYYVSGSQLRGDRTTVTNGSDKFVVQVISRASGSAQPTGSGAVATGTELAFRTSAGNYLLYSNTGWWMNTSGTFGIGVDDQLVWISR